MGMQSEADACATSNVERTMISKLDTQPLAKPTAAQIASPRVPPGFIGCSRCQVRPPPPHACSPPHGALGPEERERADTFSVGSHPSPRCHCLAARVRSRSSARVLARPCA